MKIHYPEAKPGHSDSRGLGTLRRKNEELSKVGESEHHKNPQLKQKNKKKILFGTFNINSLIQVGKLKQLTTELKRLGITILALQETRFTDEEDMESDGFRIFKGKVGKRAMKNMPHLGTAFIVDNKMLNSVADLKKINNRLSTLTIKAKNKKYTLINAHAPINEDNKKDPEKVEQFWENLENEMLKIPVNHTKILMGDFNAQLGTEKKFVGTVGKYPAHRRTNKNGERLVHLCKGQDLRIMSTHFRAKCAKKKTWVSPNPMLGEFQLDHVAVSKKSQREIQNVKVRKAINVTSDHYMSQIKIKFIPENRKNKPQNKIPKIDRESLWKEQEEFKRKLQNPTNWEEVTKNLVEPAKELASLKIHKKHAWWNKECEEAIKKRLQAWKIWNAHKTAGNLEKSQEARKEANRILRKTRRNHLKSQIEGMEKDFKCNNTRDFYGKFKRKIQGYVAPSLSFKRKDGTTAIGNTENCKILAEYFQELLNCERPQEKMDFEFTTQNPDSERPDEEEVRKAISMLKNNKASGEDGVIGEMWKLANNQFVTETTKLFRKIWEEEKIPMDWLTALIHPLHKKGPKNDVNNYRGISLLPVTYKIFSRLLLNRLEPQVDSLLGEYQGGFRKGRSCAEQILCLKMILKHYNTKTQKNIFISFVDFKKAYDSIDRDTLFDTLKEYHVDQKTINLIKLTLKDTISKVKFRGEVSDPFKIKTGVRQGDGLSPTLFNIVLDKIMRTLWENNNSGANLGTKNQRVQIKCLAFADDLALFAESEEEAIEQINQLKEIAEKTGLQISFPKTEIMTSDKTYSRRSVQTKYGKVKVVDNFKYLGENISKNGTDKKSLQNKKEKLEQLNRMTKNIYNKKNLSINTKLKHYVTVIRPVILYGMETNNLAGMESMLKEERRILRRIYGPRIVDGEYRLKSNKEIYQKIENLEVAVREKRLRFYGHMVRMNAARLNKQIFDKLWKQKTTGYTTQIKRDLDTYQITDSDCKDRELFRKKLFEMRKNVVQMKERRVGTKWTKERKEQFSKCMKTYWQKRKKENEGK